MTESEPSQIGNYRILKTLGEGAMARVYLAEMVATGGFRRKCALKVVHPEFARDSKFIELMQREARLGALLEHPNIVNTISHGDADGVHFIDLEYVEGKTLAEFLEMMDKKGKSGLDMSFCLQIILPILRGLDYAHNFTDDAWEGPPGMIHRDLKPANVMLSNQAVVKIMDFGIAKAKVSRSNLTSIGQVRGTPVYMAPEQVTGKEVGGQSDQFAAATMFYELVTGKRLFSGINLINVMQTVASADTSAAEALLDKGCPGLGEVLGRMWQREPDDRFLTCWDAAEALANVLEEFLKEPPPSRPKKSRQRSGTSSRKQKAPKARPAMFGLLSALTGRSGRKGRKRIDPETGGKRRKRKKKRQQRDTLVDTELAVQSAEDWSAASALLENSDYLEEAPAAPPAPTELVATPLDPAPPPPDDTDEEAVGDGGTISIMFMDVIFDEEEDSTPDETVDLDEVTTLRDQPVVTGTMPVPTIDQLTDPQQPTTKGEEASTQPEGQPVSSLEESLAAAALEPAIAIQTGEVEVEDTEDLFADPRDAPPPEGDGITDTLDLNPLARPHKVSSLQDPANQAQQGEGADDLLVEDKNNEQDKTQAGASDDSGAADSVVGDDFFGGMEAVDENEDDDLDDFFSSEFDT